MMSKKDIKEFAKKKYSKKIGKDVLLEIGKLVEVSVKEIIQNCARHASFSGRNTIKLEDFD